MFILYLGVVLWCCFGNFQSLPDVPQEYFGIPTDKIVHFLMFCPFPILAYFAFDFHSKTVRSSLLFAATVFIIGCIFAAATEIGQAKLTTWRSGDPTDLIADISALALASIAVIIFDRIKQRKVCSEK